MWMEGMEQHGVRRGLQRGSQEDRTAGTENPIEKYAWLRYHEDGSIVVTDDWRGQDVHRVPGKYRENIGKNIHLEKTESMHMTTIGPPRIPRDWRGS